MTQLHPMSAFCFDRGYIELFAGTTHFDSGEPAYRAPNACDQAFTVAFNGKRSISPDQLLGFALQMEQEHRLEVWLNGAPVRATPEEMLRVRSSIPGTLIDAMEWHYEDDPSIRIGTLPEAQELKVVCYMDKQDYECSEAIENIDIGTLERLGRAAFLARQRKGEERYQAQLQEAMKKLRAEQASLAAADA